jgi:hypothetical protein
MEPLTDRTTASSACDVSNTVLQQNMDVTNSDDRTEQMPSQNDVQFTPTKQDLSNGLSFVCVKDDVSLPVSFISHPTPMIQFLCSIRVYTTDLLITTNYKTEI